MSVDSRWIQSELGIDDELARRLAVYVELLLVWNKRINLTAARDAESVVREHLADSVALLPHLPADATRAVDVGAGGGFPGVVVAAARPALSLALLEPVHKKQAFLAAALRELGCTQARAHAQRVEDHLAAGHGGYDLAMSRATWALPEWLERGRALVRDGGVVLGFEGREQFELPAGAVRHDAARGDRKRAVITYQK